MSAKRFAAEAGITETEADKLLADAEREKEYITKLHNNEFLTDYGQDNKNT